MFESINALVQRSHSPCSSNNSEIHDPSPIFRAAKVSGKIKAPKEKYALGRRKLQNLFSAQYAE